MAYIKSKKVYAILMSSEEGKDIVQEAPKLNDEQLQNKLDKFFKTNHSYISSESESNETTNKFKEVVDKHQNIYEKFFDKAQELKNSKYNSDIYEKITNGELISGMFELEQDDIEAFVNIDKGTFDANKLTELPLYKKVYEYAKNKKQIPDDKKEELIEKASQEFYEAITKGKTDPKYKGNQFVLVTGLPSSGKSTGKVKEFLENSIELDNDIAKTVPCLSEYYEDGLGAGVVHPIVKEVEKKVKDRLIKEGYNIVYPVIGPDEESISKKVKAFKDNGYNLGLVNAQVSNDESRRRVFTRYVKTGRFIDDDIVKDYGEEPNETFNKILKNNGKMEYGGETYEFNIYK